MAILEIATGIGILVALLGGKKKEPKDDEDTSSEEAHDSDCKCRKCRSNYSSGGWNQGNGFHGS